MNLPHLTKKDKLKLDNHIKTQKKLRTIGKNLPKEDVELVLNDITERSYWMLIDFLTKEKFMDNKPKLKKAWEYINGGLK